MTDEKEHEGEDCCPPEPDYQYEFWAEDSMRQLDDDIGKLIETHCTDNKYYCHCGTDEFAQAAINKILDYTGTTLQVDCEGKSKVVIDKDKIFNKL